MRVRELGGVERRKKVQISASSACELLRALAEAEGLEVVAGESAADLTVIETDRPEDLETQRAGPVTPVLVVAPRRLRDAELRALRAAGASQVVDAEGSVLDVAFGFSELLFKSWAEQRRYGTTVGGVRVSFRKLDRDLSGVGRLVGIARSGGFVKCPEQVDEGAPLELSIDLAGRRVPILGRVACTAPDGFGLEFALEDDRCAPRLYSLCAAAEG